MTLNTSNIETGQILDHIKGQKAQMVQFLEELARFESPSLEPHSQQEVLGMLTQALEEIDYLCFYVPGQKTGGFLYASPRTRVKGDPCQLLVGHCDTVWPLDTLKEMPVIREDEKIKGPGVYDMKGGLTQMIFSLKALGDLGLDHSVTPLVLINTDEEIGSHESTPMIRRLAKIADRAFILEPSIGYEGKLKTSRKGVGRFTITVKGEAAHAGLDPGKGINAIVELSYIIQQLFEMNDPAREVSVNVGMVEGGVRANVVAPESKAVVDVRVPTHEDANRITSQIYNLKPTREDVILEINGNIGRPPMERTPRNRELWAKAKEASTQLGIDLEEAPAGGASDGNTTSLYTATLDGLGATGDGAHALHEFAFVDKMIERTALLVLLLLSEPLNHSA